MSILCYFHSRREPEEPEDPTKGRDVFNEKPPADELLAVSDIGKSVTSSLPDNVVCIPSSVANLLLAHDTAQKKYLCESLLID